MKTDRELLDLAAKAIGGSLRWDKQREDAPQYAPRLVGSGIWNPLNDDGDALRLAVKLGMRMRVYRCHSAHGFPRVEVVCGSRPLMQSCSDTEESYQAATRRAIVRAAAAVGETMV